MMRAWARRAATLHDELAAIADVDPRWWLLAGGAAAAEASPAREDYVISDAEPGADTFLGHRAPAPADPIRDAIARARAARTALRELEGELPEQRLAVTLRRNGETVLDPSALEVAAFALDGGCVVGELDDPGLPARIAAVHAGAAPMPWRGPVPFVCASIGEDAIETARHAHRRAWTERTGPWLGLGWAGGLATVSTCHLVVDGYGHARIAARIAELMQERAARMEMAGTGVAVAETLRPVRDAVPLGVAWRELPAPAPAPRALPLAYALGQILYRRAGRRDARFSPTFQVPVAPGRPGDPMRRRRRVVPAAISVRFEDGCPEPFPVFEARARAILTRESAGEGLMSRLLAAARAAPAPLAWKRRGISANRPRWLERFAEVIGGRACLSRIAVDIAMPPTCAVSSPPRLAAAADPFGACVITVIDDGARAAITACGSGLAGTSRCANALLDELLATV